MMKNLTWTFAMIALLCCTLIDAQAQIRTPQPSPTVKFEQPVGLTTVTLEYSRPSVKDRTVFGEEGLVRYGEIWRTGANSATKITFSSDVKVGGEELEAGAYAILTMPGEKKWDVMFYPFESAGFGSYVEKDPVAKVEVMAQKTGRKVESFTIDINNLRNESATIDMMWDNVLVSIPMEVNTDEAVMANINRVMGGPSTGDYYAAASYYLAADKDMNQALTWIKKANADNPQYWMMRTEALIQANLGNYSDAIAAAEKSKAMAEKAGNMDYVRMNDKSIAEWKSKAKNMPEKAKMMPKQKQKSDSNSKS